ncbi:MAG: hypothetical protein JNM17_24150 [Archangium sp.]|nr:hypothetical protein [Archangium sp.]
MGCGRRESTSFEAGKTIVVLGRSGGGTGGGTGAGTGGSGGGFTGGGSGGGGGVGGGIGGGLTGGGASGGGGGGGGSSSCSGLDAIACRARPDCAADFCITCDCNPRYAQCRGLNEAPFQCPEVDCVTPLCCSTQAQCPTFPTTCAPPGTPPGCGICDMSPGTCQTDSACGAGFICEPRQCGCLGQRDCVPGCSANNPCGLGFECNHNRCTEKECALDNECPPTFECRIGHVGGFCRRRICTTDQECGDGFCVEGTCFEGLGECRGPVP